MVAAAIEKELQAILSTLQAEERLRTLKKDTQGIDLSSNDYLSLSHSGKLLEVFQTKLAEYSGTKLGATGSRLISGDNPQFHTLEEKIAHFHQAESALLFNSGYDANIGLLSTVAQKGDTIIYDALCHASIRDGLRLSRAKSFSFRHNDLEDLKKKMASASGNIFIVIESIYSMDGDAAPLCEIVEITDGKAALIVDEAHGGGIFGEQGEGLVVKEGLSERVWARVYTYGKAFGCHGAAVVGSKTLKEYLVNFARSFIYTTGLTLPHLLMIESSYDLIASSDIEREKLFSLIETFCEMSDVIDMETSKEKSPIQYVLCPGNEEVLALSRHLQSEGFAAGAIRSPTVATGTERIRICLHTHNSPEEVKSFFGALSTYKT